MILVSINGLKFDMGRHMEVAPEVIISLSGHEFDLETYKKEYLEDYGQRLLDDNGLLDRGAAVSLAHAIDRNFGSFFKEFWGDLIPLVKHLDRIWLDVPRLKTFIDPVKEYFAVKENMIDSIMDPSLITRLFIKVRTNGDRSLYARMNQNQRSCYSALQRAHAHLEERGMERGALRTYLNDYLRELIEKHGSLTPKPTAAPDSTPGVRDPEADTLITRPAGTARPSMPAE